MKDKYKLKCLRCGQCCTSASLMLYNVPADQDRMELGKWLENHHCRIETVDTPGGPVLGVRIPIICRHLVYDHDGIATCKIYDTRPQICREHRCQRIS